MNHHFKAKRPDGRSVRKVLSDYIEPRVNRGELPIGTILTHTTLKGLLEEGEIHSYSAAIKGVSRELQVKHSRALQNVRGRGYCLIGGASQIEYGQVYRKRGQRSIKTGLSLMKSADRSVMSPADINWAQKIQDSMEALATIAKMHDERLIEHHQAIEQLRNTQMRDKRNYTATADEVADLRRQMEEQRRQMDELRKERRRETQ